MCGSAMTEARPTIAIVDDEAPVRIALHRLCSAYGMDPHTFASAQELLDAMHGDLPQCLVLDVHMPGLDGLEAQAMLLARGINIPTIVITGRDSDEKRKRAAALGVRAYLRKPIDADVLLGAINEAIACHTVST